MYELKKYAELYIHSDFPESGSEEDAHKKTRALLIETHRELRSLLRIAKEARTALLSPPTSDEVSNRSEDESICIIDEKSIFSMDSMDDLEYLSGDSASSEQKVRRKPKSMDACCGTDVK